MDPVAAGAVARGRRRQALGQVAAGQQTLAREYQKPETEVMTMAFDAGLRQQGWRERHRVVDQTGLSWNHLGGVLVEAKTLWALASSV